MSNHGTASIVTPGQRAEFVAAGAKAFTLIADDLGPELTVNWSRNGAAIQKILRQEMIPPNVPIENEWFSLALDYNKLDNLETIRDDHERSGRGESIVEKIEEVWTYAGPNFQGERRYWAKLIRLGVVKTLNEAKQRAAVLGYRLLEGQAMHEFITKYPNKERREYESIETIIFGGSDWHIREEQDSYIAGLQVYDDGGYYLYLHRSAGVFHTWGHETSQQGCEHLWAVTPC